MAIISSLDCPLKSLATRADRILEASSLENVDAIAKDQMTELADAVYVLSGAEEDRQLAEGRPATTTALTSTIDYTTTNKGVHYFHERYGSDACRCRPRRAI